MLIMIPIIVLNKKIASCHLITQAYLHVKFDTGHACPIQLSSLVLIATMQM